MRNSTKNTSNKALELLPKFSNYFIGISILCYGTGFAITNLYLGSMGIVTFDLLRARYILAGLLFSFFIGAITYLVTGLRRTLLKHFQKSKIIIIGKVLWFSFLNISILYFVIPAIGLFAGSMDTKHYTIPQPTQPEIPWSDWLSTTPLSVLLFSSILFGLIILTVVFIGTIVIIINPKDKDGVRTTRKETISATFKQIRESKSKVIFDLIGLYVLLYLINLASNIMSFYMSGKISSTTSTTFTYPYGWTQLFNAIIIIYAFIAIYFTFIALYPPTTISDDLIESKSLSWIYLIAIGIIITIPIYVTRVYPSLPQQIGGGQLINVQVILSENTIEPLFEDPCINTYLIDKTTSTSFFLLQNTTKSKYKIVEIRNELIQNLTYAHYP